MDTRLTSVYNFNTRPPNKRPKIWTTEVKTTWNLYKCNHVAANLGHPFGRKDSKTFAKVQQVIEDKFTVICCIRSRVHRLLFNSVQVEFNSLFWATLAQCYWELQNKTNLACVVCMTPKVLTVQEKQHSVITLTQQLTTFWNKSPRPTVSLLNSSENFSVAAKAQSSHSHLSVCWQPSSM